MLVRKLDSAEVSYTVSYPVYGDMVHNYNAMYRLATDFYKLVELENGKGINLIFTGSSGCMLATICFCRFK